MSKLTQEEKELYYSEEALKREMEREVIYVAVSRETGKVVSGQKGQAGFFSKSQLNKSVGYSVRSYCKRHGIEPKDLYYIMEIPVPAKEEYNYVNFSD